jgi:flagellin-specific chaperone FliS
LRQNGNNHLRAAREALDQGNLADAGEAAKKALEIFSEMYKTYAAAHK